MAHDPEYIHATLLRESEMKCQRCGEKIGPEDKTELCKIDPDGKFTKANLRVLCDDCATAYWDELRRASRP